MSLDSSRKVQRNDFVLKAKAGQLKTMFIRVNTEGIYKISFSEKNFLSCLGLVTLTATAGYLIAPGPFSVVTLTGATIGTMLCSASANSLNQVIILRYI